MTDNSKKIERHPCFSAHAAGTHMRVHLPVAPLCTIQCRYCNRKYDCVNESRPGVTSAILLPDQALRYLRPGGQGNGRTGGCRHCRSGRGVCRSRRNAADTPPRREKLSRHLALCSHQRARRGRLYRGTRLDRRYAPYRDRQHDRSCRRCQALRLGPVPEESPAGHRCRACLIERQLETVRRCKLFGLAVKINTIVVPGVNDSGIGETAAAMAALGADTINCMPLLPVSGSEFGHMARPDHELMQKVRWQAGAHLQTVNHCGRCRADAAGIIGRTIPPAPPSF